MPSDSSPGAPQYSYSAWQIHLIFNPKFALSWSEELNRCFSHEKWHPACCWHFASNPKNKNYGLAAVKKKMCFPAKPWVSVPTKSYMQSSTLLKEEKLCRLSPAHTPQSSWAAAYLLVQGICSGKGSLLLPACQELAEHHLLPSVLENSISAEGANKP